MPFPYTPYPIYGTINIANSSSISVKAVNNTTAEEIEVTSETDSTYLIDCANFENGYSDTDIISIITHNILQVQTIDLTNYPAGRQLDIEPYTSVTNSI